MHEIQSDFFDKAQEQQRNSSNIVTNLKAFLQEQIKAGKLVKGKAYVIDAKDFNDTTDIHYYAIKKATLQTLTKGKAKGKANNAYDKELNTLVKIAFPIENKLENARVNAIAIKVL
jgi:hypothetical protein